MSFFRRWFSLMSIIFPFLGCSNQGPFLSGPRLPSPPSTFTEEGPRYFTLSTISVRVRGSLQSHLYYLRAPVGYNANKTKPYPLVVYLHAWGVDNRPKAVAKDSAPVPEAIRRLPDSVEHPAFVYVPICPPPYYRSVTGFMASELSAPKGGEWNSDPAKAMVLDTIRNLQNRFHIDPERIYFVGFSMGGSGSWYLASAYRSFTGLDVAGILRGAGWYLASMSSQPEKPRVLNLIYDDVSRVPTWLHIGEADSESRSVAESTLEEFERRFASGPAIHAFRTSASGELMTNPGESVPLAADFTSLPLKTGAEFRLSVYKKRGHEELAFCDKESLDWLLAQHR